MENILAFLGNLLLNTLLTIVKTLGHNWFILLFGIVTAVVLKTYVNTERLSGLLMRRAKVSILASVLVGTFTPFCACGTMAVIVGMLTTTLPWGPIMAFLTSSPLMSPDGFIMISGMISVRFAVALTIASVLIGLVSGFTTPLIEKKTSWLKNQSRYQASKASPICACSGSMAPAADTAASPDRSGLVACESDQASTTYACHTETPLPRAAVCCAAAAGTCCPVNANQITSRFYTLAKTLKLRELGANFVTIGLKQILFYFSIFVGVGYLVNTLVPMSIISMLFGANNVAAVPLAALIGLPLYLTTESGIPIIQSLLQSGADEGAMLAFLITGSATSAWVIAGLSTFMKKRVIGLYVLYIVLGGIVSGFLYDFLIALPHA